MVYKEATFEEYSKAKQFAKIRYRFGVYIQLIALVLFILLFAYAVTNIEEMKANPKEYAEEHLGVLCNYPIQPVYTINIDDDNIATYLNGTGK